MPDFNANNQSNLAASQLTPVVNNGTPVATRRGLNFKPGSNVTITTADDPANNRVDVTIAASGGGGGAADQLDANGTTLDVNAISDGQFLKRVGTAIVGAAVTAVGANADTTAPEEGIEFSTGPFDHQSTAIQAALDASLQLVLPSGTPNDVTYPNTDFVNAYSIVAPIGVPAWNGALRGDSAMVGMLYRPADGAHYTSGGNDVEGAALYFKKNLGMENNVLYMQAGAMAEAVVENIGLNHTPGANGTGRSRVTGFWFNIKQDTQYTDYASRVLAPGFWQTHGRFRANNLFANQFERGYAVYNNNYGHLKRLVAGSCDVGMFFAPDGADAVEGNVDARICQEFSAWDCNIGFLNVWHPSSFAGDNAIEWFMIKRTSPLGCGFAMANSSGKASNCSWLVKGLGTEYGQRLDGSAITRTYKKQAVNSTYSVTLRSAEISVASGNLLILAEGSHSATDGARIACFLDGDEAYIDCQDYSAPMQTLFTSYANHKTARIRPNLYFPGGGTVMNMDGWPRLGAFPITTLYDFSADYWRSSVTAFNAPMRYDGNARSSLHSSWTPLRPQFSNCQGGVTTTTAIAADTGELCTKITFPNPTQTGAATKSNPGVGALRLGGLSTPGSGRSMAITQFLRGGASAAAELSGAPFLAVMMEVYNDENFDVHMQNFFCAANGTSYHGSFDNAYVDTRSADYWAAGQRVYDHVTFWSKSRVRFCFINPRVTLDKCFAFMPFAPLDTSMSLHITKFAFLATTDKAALNEFVRDGAWRMPG